MPRNEFNTGGKLTTLNSKTLTEEIGKNKKRYPIFLDQNN